MINTNWGAAPNPEVYRFWTSEKGCNIDRFKKIKKECKNILFVLSLLCAQVAPQHCLILKVIVLLYHN